MFLFEPVRMKSMYDDAYLQSGLYNNGTTDLVVPNGTLGVMTYELITDPVYNEPDFNVWRIAPTATATDKGIFVFDFAEVPEAMIGDYAYRIGVDITNITMPAGRVVRWRELAVNDYFWLGSSNFTTTPNLNEYANITANGIVAPAASATAGQLNLKIVDTKTVYAGLDNKGIAYLCVVTSL